MAGSGQGCSHRLARRNFVPETDAPEPDVVVTVAVATAEVFQAPELTRNTPRITIRSYLRSGGRNDCEPVVVSRHPEVGRALDWLGRRGAARLTGTGSCVFATFGGRDEAAAALAGLPSEWLGFVARGLDISPLAARRAGERGVNPG